MGGVPSLGYAVQNRRLAPNAQKVKLIQHIFERFIEHGSSTQLVMEFQPDDVTSKAWTTQNSKVREGNLVRPE